MLGDSLERLKLLALQQHFVPRLRIAWNYAQIGLLLLPLIPPMGEVAIFLALVATWRRQYYAITRRPLNWGLAALAGLLVLTVAFAANRLDAFLGLFNFLPFFIAFAAFSELFQTTVQLKRISWILVISSTPAIVIGLGQLFWGWVSPEQWQVILGWAIAPQGNPPGRMASIFMYANTFAGYLVIVFILGLGLWLEQYHQIRTDREVKSKFALLFLTVAIIGNLTALILTNSRNAWAIALLACFVYALYQGWRWVIAGVVAIASSILWAAFGTNPLRDLLRNIVPPFFWARLTDQLYPDRPVALLRSSQWRFAWHLATERPWTGWGLRNFSTLYEAKMHLWLGHPHNLFLMLAAEIGIPTTLFFCSLVAWVLVSAIALLINWQHSSTNKLIFFSYVLAFFACTLFNSVDVTLFDLRLNTLSWLLLSAICGVGYRAKDSFKA